MESVHAKISENNFGEIYTSESNTQLNSDGGSEVVAGRPRPAPVPCGSDYLPPHTRELGVEARRSGLLRPRHLPAPQNHQAYGFKTALQPTFENTCLRVFY
jgi:hypothetical protein